MPKNLFNILVIGFLSLVFLLNACKSKPPVDKEPPGFPIHPKQVVIPFYPESPTPRLTLSLDVPVLSGPLQELIQQLLYEGVAPEVYADRLAEAYKNQYFEMKTVLEEYPDFPQDSLNWEYVETLHADCPSAQILVLSRSKDYYLGGAHGMREKQYFVINTELKKQLHIADLIKPSKRAGVRQCIAEELRNLAEISPLDPLTAGGFFEDTVEIPDNFFLTPQGIGFHWDPYEIAPYVMGPLEILLPYEGLKDFLAPGVTQ